MLTKKRKNFKGRKIAQVTLIKQSTTGKLIEQSKFDLPDYRSTVAKRIPGNQSQSVLVKIRGIVQRVLEDNKFQGRYKRVGIRIKIGPNAEAHGLPLSNENPFIVRRQAIGVIRGGVDHAPQSPIHHLIKNRRRIFAVDPSVVVRGTDHVFGSAINVDGVAELLVRVVQKRKRSNGREDRNEAMRGDDLGGPSGDKFSIGKPYPAVEFIFSDRTAINQNS